MNKNVLFYVVIILVGIISLALWQYVLVVYEVRIDVTPNQLFADNTSSCTIKVVPLNSFGRVAPFRSASAKFEIESGEDLIIVLEKNEKEGMLKIQALNNEGELVIFVNSKLSLLPSKVIIPINKNFT